MPNLLDRRTLLTRGLIMSAALGCPYVVGAEPPNRTRLATQSASLPTSVRTLTLRGEEDQRVPVNAIAINPRTGGIVIAGDDQTIRVVDSVSMRVIKTIGSHRDRIRTLAFDAEGNKLISAGNDGQLILWDVAHNYRVQKRLGGTPALARVCFHPTLNEIAAVGFDHEVFIINGEKRGKPRKTHRSRKLICHCRDLRTVTYRDDGQLIAVAGRSGDLHLFDADSGAMLVDKNIHRGRINDAVFARQSNRLVTVGDDGFLCVFDTGRRKTIQRQRITTGKLFSIAVLTSQLVAVAGSDNDIRLVNIDNGNTVRTLQGHRGSIPTLASDGGYLFSGGFDATLRRWDIGNLQGDQQRIAEGTRSEKK